MNLNWDIVGGLLGPAWVLIWIAFLIAVAVVQIAFAIGVYRDADLFEEVNQRRTAFVGPIIWTLATLFGGVFVATAYWAMHRSTLARVEVVA